VVEFFLLQPSFLFGGGDLFVCGSNPFVEVEFISKGRDNSLLGRAECCRGHFFVLGAKLSLLGTCFCGWTPSFLSLVSFS
jgi:hypothetical protein